MPLSGSEWRKSDNQPGNEATLHGSTSNAPQRLGALSYRSAVAKGSRVLAGAVLLTLGGSASCTRTKPGEPRGQPTATSDAADATADASAL